VTEQDLERAARLWRLRHILDGHREQILDK
jgi:hypothetical protein